MQILALVKQVGVMGIAVLVAVSLAGDGQAAVWEPLEIGAATIPIPRSLEPGITLELVAAEPQIVTPVSCRFDSRGRLLVVESHTHFPPQDYEGPRHDRVRILRDSNGDGALDQIATFHEGTHKTMGMAIAADDSVYLATRNSVIRLRDTTGDDQADQVETLLTLETKADYPHNGLSGLLLDEAAGTLTVGMGENFGAAYTLTDREGHSLRGSGEGGNIFECSLDGKGLKWVATGIWNPFGLCRDDAGRVLMVDNDPDSRPPCRILEVLPMADYGFQFRFGRSGTHPLEAWDGELPGTLPMVAGTGEAPCAILPYRGGYWVTSWGDNRIERYEVKPSGASIKSEMEVPIFGGPDFRPVDLAVAADGSIYVTDWVDRSYNAHGRGRVWRIRFAEEASAEIPPLSEQEKLARETDVSTEKLIQRLATEDVFTWQWALAELAAREAFTERTIDSLDEPQARLAWLMAQRWSDLTASGIEAEKREQILTMALRDPGEDVRLMAIRWVVEARVETLTEEVAQLLKRPEVSPRMLAAIAAGLSFLKSGEVKREGRGYFDQRTAQRLIEVATDASYADATRIAALRLVPPEVKPWSGEKLEQLLQSTSGQLQREVARHLAVAALRDDDLRQLAVRLAESKLVSAAAKRDISAVLAPAQLSPESSAAAELSDLDAWLTKIGVGGDPGAGWRVFFGATGNCFACHRLDGRGGNVGPDLNGIGASQDRRRLLQSILEPSREMAPMYVPFSILTVNGKTRQGLKIFGGDGSTTFLGIDGKVFELPLKEIELQQPSEISIMPANLHEQLTIAQLRNVLALLEGKKQP
ncbi:MAG: PVC-type heme-binding CxxCH protein [Pirellulaceae bacterium]